MRRCLRRIERMGWVCRKGSMVYLGEIVEARAYCDEQDA